jgi:hypothetical protein
VATAASAVPRTLSVAKGSGPEWDRVANHQFSSRRPPEAESRKPEAPRRMLAVTQFFEDDDMAFVLDRMLSHRSRIADNEPAPGLRTLLRPLRRRRRPDPAPQHLERP